MTNTKWHYIKLGEFCKIIMGQSPPSLTYNKLGEGLPFFQGVKDFGRMYPTKRVYCTADTRKIAYSGDVLLSVRAPVGEVNVASEKCMIGRGLAALRVKTGNNDDQRFLYYLMLFNKKFWRQLHSGTTFEEITKSDIENLEISIPQDSSERGKIADILGSLDDKIELNYEMNKTLEAIAQAIFKNWFVDFEPFKDELVYNEELDKEAPRSWEIASIAKIADIYLGGTPRTSEPDYWNGNIKWASAKDVANTSGLYVFETEKTITEEGLNNSNTKVLPAYTIVITARGTVGEIRFLGEPMAFNQTCYGLLSKEGVSSYWLFNALKTAIKEMKSLTYGTVFDTITMRTFEELKFPKPPAKIVEEFTRTVEPIYELIKINEQESITLAQIRDTLLPKLLSGEIRVKVDFEEEFPEEAKKLEELEGEKVKLQESLERWLK